MEVLCGFGVQVRRPAAAVRVIRLCLAQRERRVVSAPMRAGRAPALGCAARLIRFGHRWCSDRPWLWRWLGWCHGCCPDRFFRWEAPRARCGACIGPVVRARPHLLVQFTFRLRRGPFEAVPPDMRLYYKEGIRVPRGYLPGTRLVPPREWRQVADEVYAGCTVRISRCGRFWVVRGWM